MTVTDLHSIQGEQEIEKWGPKVDPRMSDDAAQEYVARHSAEVAKCRARGRHLFEKERFQSPIFVDRTPEGLWVRKTMDCECCNLVGRKEFWERGRDKMWRLVAAEPDYTKRGPNGEKYLADPGNGRMAPRQAMSAITTNQLHQFTLTELGAQVKQHKKDAAKAQLENVKAKYAKDNKGAKDAKDADHTAETA